METTVPQSRRDVWLTIALAVAKGDIPQPDEFEVRDDINAVSLVYNGRVGNPDPIGQAATAGAFLDLGEPSNPSPTIRVWWDNRGGWSWTVRAYLAKPEEQPSLAEQVVATIGGAS